jgi:hypothetical protein
MTKTTLPRQLPAAGTRTGGGVPAHPSSQESMCKGFTQRMFHGRKKSELAFYAATLVATILCAWPELLPRVSELARGAATASGIAPVAAFAAIWVVSSSGLWCFLAFGPRALRVVAGPVFVASGVFICWYYLSLNQPLEAVGLERMLDARTFVGDAVAQYRPQLFKAILFNVPLAGVVLFSTLRQNPVGYSSLLAKTAGVLLLCLATFVIALVCWIRAGQGTVGLPPPLRLVAYSGALLADQYYGQSAHEHRPVTDRPQGGLAHVVLVVDESIVDDVLRKGSDVWVDANSLPSGIEYDFGPAVSGGNCSSDSNLILRVGPRPLHLNEDLGSYATVWEYAKHAGYETIYIDAQEQSDHLHNWMTARERHFIDHVYVFPNVPVAQRDRQAGELVSKLLSKGPPRFIYVNKVGAHFPWDSKYPAEAARYQPTTEVVGDPLLAHAANQRGLLAKIDDLSGTERFKNSYRNAVEWNLNTFFQALRGLSQDESSVLIYTSDHGQNVWRENGITATHCTGVPRSATRVPVIVFTASPKWSGILRKTATDNFGKTSHFNIFASVLQFLGYQAPYQEARMVPLWSPDPSPDGVLTVKEDVTLRFGSPTAMKLICAKGEKLLPRGRCVDSAVPDRRDLDGSGSLASE